MFFKNLCVLVLWMKWASAGWTLRIILYIISPKPLRFTKTNLNAATLNTCTQEHVSMGYLFSFLSGLWFVLIIAGLYVNVLVAASQVDLQSEIVVERHRVIQPGITENRRQQISEINYHCFRYIVQSNPSFFTMNWNHIYKPGITENRQQQISDTNYHCFRYIVQSNPSFFTMNWNHNYNIEVVFNSEILIPPTIVLASRASGCHLDTQTLKNPPSRHPNSLSNFLKCQSQAYNLPFFFS